VAVENVRMIMLIIDCKDTPKQRQYKIKLEVLICFVVMSLAAYSPITNMVKLNRRKNEQSLSPI
jgi:hypothetical protein